MAVIGDRVQISSRKVGEAPRDGVVTGVTGSLFTGAVVDWGRVHRRALGGLLAVIGKQSGSGGRRRQTTSASATKGQIGARAVPRRVAASKQVAGAAKEGSPGDAVADRPKGCQGRRAAKEGQQAPR